MSKKTKTMIASLVVLVVLIAAFAAVMLFHQSTEEKEAKAREEAENGMVIDTNDTDKIIGFSYTNKAPGYDNSPFVFEKTGDKWIYDGDKEFPLLQDAVNSMVDTFGKVYAKRIVEENCKDWAKYGLDEPVMTISQTTGSQEKTYYVGDYNSSAEGYYMYMKDQDTVYIVDGTLWITYSVDLYDLVKMPAYPTLKSDHFIHVKYEIKDGDTLDFYFERDPDTGESAKPYETAEKSISGTWYIMDKEGNKVPANPSRTSILMSTLVDMEYVREVSYKPTDEQRKECQLDDPNVKITIEYTEDTIDQATVTQVPIQENLSEIQFETYDQAKKLVLNIGAMSDAYEYQEDYYFQLDGMREIVTLAESDVELFRTLKLEDYIASDNGVAQQ